MNEIFFKFLYNFQDIAFINPANVVFVYLLVRLLNFSRTVKNNRM